MTVEQRTTIDLADLDTLRLQCPHCALAMEFSLRQPVDVPALCPSCKERWWHTTDRGFQAVHEWCRAVRQLTAADGEVTVRVGATLRGSPTP